MQTVTKTQANLVDIPLNKIEGGNQFRRVDKRTILGLQESIAEKGLLQPIRVRPLHDGNYALEFGHHRVGAIRGVPALRVRPMRYCQACDDKSPTPFKAYRLQTLCEKCGTLTTEAETIPGFIVDENETEATLIQIIENLHRNDRKNYALMGDWFTKLIDIDHWDIIRIAKEIRESVAFVERCMKFSRVIDPKIHAELDIIPRSLTYDFSRIAFDRQAAALNKIKTEMDSADGKLSTERIKELIRTRLPLEKKENEQHTSCRNCRGVLSYSEIAAGFAVVKDGHYVHANPENCHFHDILAVTYTGKQSQTIRAIIEEAKQKAEQTGATASSSITRRKK